MKTVPYINGWWRLWIVTSLIWLLAISGIAYRTWPSNDYALDHPAFYYQLDAKQRSLLESEGTNPLGDAVQMLNGHVLHFRQGVPVSEQEAVARAYHDITVRALIDMRREHIQSFAALALIPCFLVALLGIGIAWVRAGFKGSNNEA